MINHFISWLYTRRLWGIRCIDYDPGCACCEAWAIHDWLFNGAPDPVFVAHLARLADGVESGEIETIRLTGKTDEEVLGLLYAMSPDKIEEALAYDGSIDCGAKLDALQATQDQTVDFLSDLHAERAK